MKIIVVGAGIVGVSVARALAVAGSDVVLLDRWGPGRGTTATTFAWTNANHKPDPAYQRLNVAGMEEHEKLAKELGGTPAYFRGGGLHCADARGESWLTENVERLRSRDYPAQWVDRDEARRIAGDVRIPETTTAIAHFPSEGYVLPERLLAAVLDDARRHGATLTIGEVVAVGDGPEGASVTLADGTVLGADRVVVATGRWTDGLAARSGFDIPMVTDARRGSPIVGLLGYVRSPAIDLRCVLHTPDLNLRPDADGATVAQALDLSSSVDPADGEADTGISAAVAARFTALTGRPSPEIDFRVAIRSMPADGHTIAGYPLESARIYFLVTHSGITLAPVLARLAAAEIVTDTAQDALAAFRPARFVGVPRSEPAVKRPTRLGEQ
ncbi:FAD-binding oxidoreductase [Amycolatopsis sp. WAC 01376]|uniref:NAD(P)/FAD-dependent oxidoreductase n=1 Tax=Amycolatopsis sp. WAC 01376 TaxID=2203195 RepID=UPI000F79F7C7|nr:FAD-binding oxidoreductase [Amycolatopsis sp. WAC 01376]RSM51873.1 FAD-binding oxidoreductase [Amycolatopsis sp. WAC 01376]